MLRGAFTPMYADPDHSPGGAYDIYSLGVIGYQLLLGDFTRRPGPAMESELRKRNVPTSVIAVLATCMAPADERWSATSLANALEMLIESQPRGVAVDERSGAVDASGSGTVPTFDEAANAEDWVKLLKVLLAVFVPFGLLLLLVLITR